MSVALILALTSTASLQCDLQAADAAVIRFGLTRNDGQVSVTPVSGGRWPTSTRQGEFARRTERRASLSSSLWSGNVELGGGSRSVVIELRPLLNDPQVAEVTLRGPRGLPVAVGYCSGGAGDNAVQSISTPVSDLLTNLEERPNMNSVCQLVAQDGRRSAFKAQQTGERSLMIEPTDEVLWPKKPITFQYSQAPRSSDPFVLNQWTIMPQGASRTPYGDQALYRSGDGKSGALIIRFWKTTDKDDVEAIANCGIGKFSRELPPS